MVEQELAVNGDGVCPAMRLVSKEQRSAVDAQLPSWSDVERVLSMPLPELHKDTERFEEEYGFKNWWSMVLPWYCFSDSLVVNGQSVGVLEMLHKEELRRFLRAEELLERREICDGVSSRLCGVPGPTRADGPDATTRGAHSMCPK